MCFGLNLVIFAKVAGPQKQKYCKRLIGAHKMARRAGQRGRWAGIWTVLVAVLLAASPGTPSSVAGDAILSNFRALDADRSWSHGGKAAVIPRVSSVAGEAGGQGKQSRMTLMLDLDKTCLFGNDGNDLGLCLQYMSKGREAVQELYNRIINPAKIQKSTPYSALYLVYVLGY